MNAAALAHLMRRTLLGLKIPTANAPRSRQRLLIAALLTWLRLTLFTGIALLVYYSALRCWASLTLVELVWFIGRPVWSKEGVA
jgi:hypothetical protein